MDLIKTLKEEHQQFMVQAGELEMALSEVTDFLSSDIQERIRKILHKLADGL